MEITLDIGKNIANAIEEIAKDEKQEFEIMALKILDLGLRVYQSSKEKVDDKQDPILENILNLSLENGYLIKEVIGHVFARDRSAIKAYDAPSAITVAENMARAFMQGKNGV